MGTIIFYPVTLTLKFNPFFKNFNLANNFWTVGARALRFHMNIPCDKSFQYVPLFFTLWPWPWSLTHFLKTWTLQITLEQWVLKLWYFTWVFLGIKPFCGYHYFLPCDLNSKFDPFLSRLVKREDSLLSCTNVSFLANHRLCMHPQDELVRIYQYLFTSFQNLFLSTLYTLRGFVIFKTILNHW